MDIEELANPKFTFFGQGSELTGDFSLIGETRISSQIKGSVFMKNDSLLTLEPKAKFIGEIKCHNIDIFGQFDGKISASGKAVIHPGSVVSGEIIAENLIIYPGSVANLRGSTL